MQRLGAIYIYICRVFLYQSDCNFKFDIVRVIRFTGIGSRTRFFTIWKHRLKLWYLKYCTNFQRQLTKGLFINYVKHLGEDVYPSVTPWHKCTSIKTLGRGERGLKYSKRCYVIYEQPIIKQKEKQIQLQGVQVCRCFSKEGLKKYCNQALTRTVPV